MADAIFVKSFFPTLEDEGAEAVAAELTEQRLRAGTRLVREAEMDNRIHFVASGVLKSVCSTNEGRDMIECILVGGDIFVTGMELMEECPSVSSVIASSDSVVCSIQKDAAYRLMTAYPVLMMEIGHYSFRSSCRYRNFHLAMTSLSAKARYKWFVKSFPEAASVMKQYEIASLLGVTPEHLSSTIRAVRAETQKEEKPAGAMN